MADDRALSCVRVPVSRSITRLSSSISGSVVGEGGSRPQAYYGVRIRLAHLANSPNHQLSANAPEREDTSSDSHQRGHDCAGSDRLHTH